MLYNDLILRLSGIFRRVQLLSTHEFSYRVNISIMYTLTLMAESRKIVPFRFVLKADTTLPLAYSNTIYLYRLFELLVDRCKRPKITHQVQGRPYSPIYLTIINRGCQF